MEDLDTREGKRYLERSLGLPLRYLDEEANLTLPETQALLKMIRSMPWILEVADNDFDPEIAQLILQREAINIKIKERSKP